MSKEKNEKKIRRVRIKDEDYNEPTQKRAKSADKGSLLHKPTPLQRIGAVLSAAGTAILCMILILIITLCIVVTALAVYVMQFAESSFDVDLRDVELSYSSFLYATNADGEDVLVKQVSSDKEDRVWTDIEDIPQHVLDAFISVEDERFFEHDGVDWKRTLSVTVKAVFDSGTEGGSTITQQLVRDITQDKETTIGRKLREIFRALSLENKYTKYDILESYLNRISFGGTSCGIGSAAYQYFGKDVKDLTIAEAAILAGLVRSPSNYNPYANLRQSRIRQTYALDQMYKNGYISTREYEEAYEEQVRFRRPVKGDYYGYVDERYNEYYGIYEDESEEDLYYENVSWDEILGEASSSAYQWNGDYTVSQNWYVDAALNQIINDFADLFDISYSAAREKFSSGGYTAYLNMDMEMQDKLEAKARDPYTFLTAYDATLPADSKNLLQGAFVIMDYRGNVLAVAGGFGEKPGDNCFNRATQAVSAIGSTIKPIGNYSLAIDMDLITYSTMQKDSSGRIPAAYAGEGSHDASAGYDEETDTVRWPHNYEQAGFGTGNYYPTWYAIQQSMNTIAARTMQKVGLTNSFNQLVHQLGFSHLDSVNDVAYSPLATGGLTDGATLVELTAAYQIMGNGGMYYKPYFYSKVVDSNGKTVLEQDTTGKRAIAEDSAWITNRMMLKVIQDEYGTGKNAKLGSVEVVGKTGTANDWSNLLFAGLTPRYVACYRLAYDDNHEIKKTDGYRTLAMAWHDIMVEMVDTETEQSFTPDSSTLTLSYCNETGLLATSQCPQTTIGYYRASNIPASCDSKHDGTYWAEHDEAELPIFR
ncbi:MAG: transglycosylase domain-containing protein [Bacteroides sp.]|nr:transglycosylase domain-containing protein [Eubacterium sp.]MCM1417352.1 transglycosylase domain-containing protein [Roseburia sp.]MCM1461455.1 transglycosylase domain-containing protein [Bacteroides sp.]